MFQIIHPYLNLSKRINPELALIQLTFEQAINFVEAINYSEAVLVNYNIAKFRIMH